MAGRTNPSGLTETVMQC